MTTLAEIDAADRQLDDAAVAARPRVRMVTLAPPGRWSGFGFHELWDYRGLLAFLVWRDFKVRYAQTALGPVWSLLQPLLNTFVFTIIFGVFAKLPSDGVPYPLFALAAQVPWMFFSNAFSAASNSLVQNTNLVTKVYFPRLVIPLSSVAIGIVDFAIALILLAAAMVWYGAAPTLRSIAVLPLVIATMGLLAVGVGCWLAALNIKYRDVKYVTPVLLQLWQYASPVAYAMSLVPPRWRALYALNPMAGVIEGFRGSLLGTSVVPWRVISISLVTGVVICVGGIAYFRRMEHYFADVA